MKRILAILLLASMMLVMASCGASGPDKTVEKYVEAMFDFDLKKVSKYVAVDYEDIFDAMIQQIMEKEKISKKEALAELSEELDTDIKKYNDFVKYIKNESKESMEKEFKLDGKYDIEVSVVASEILEEDAKYAAIKSASADYDEYKVILSEEINLAKVKECRKVTAKAYFYNDGSDVFSLVLPLEVYAVKIGSKWIVLDGGMGMDF